MDFSDLRCGFSLQCCDAGIVGCAITQRRALHNSLGWCRPPRVGTQGPGARANPRPPIQASSQNATKHHRARHSAKPKPKFRLPAAQAHRCLPASFFSVEDHAACCPLDMASWRRELTAALALQSQDRAFFFEQSSCG